MTLLFTSTTKHNVLQVGLQQDIFAHGAKEIHFITMGKKIIVTFSLLFVFY